MSVESWASTPLGWYEYLSWSQKKVGMLLLISEDMLSMKYRNRWLLKYLLQHSAARWQANLQSPGKMKDKQMKHVLWC